jgi:DivIVA domain-containing protein
METKTRTPNFTVSLRGYDREEVDGYLDSLSEAIGQIGDAEEHNRLLQSHINRLNSRIKELEDRLRSDTPKTGMVLGERIGMLLREAEDVAAATITEAQQNASETVAEAERKSAERVADADTRLAAADETVRQTIARAEEQARRIETGARGEAEEIVSEAEARAGARTRQIEQWAEQVVSHTRAEEARMLKEQADKRAVAQIKLDEMAAHRNSAAAVLGELRDSIARALEIAHTPVAGSSASSTQTPSVSSQSEDAFSASADTGGTSSHLAASAAASSSGPASASRPQADEDESESPGLGRGTDEFETLLEAWVSEGNNNDDNM